METLGKKEANVFELQNPFYRNNRTIQWKYLPKTKNTAENKVRSSEVNKRKKLR